jgi:hypothetical protein
MMSILASEMKQRLLAMPSTRDHLEGASGEEIQELEKYAGGPFPAVYRQFLEQLGRSAGALFRGTEYSVRQRFQLRLREHAERILKRGAAPFALPATAFVFLMSPGSQFSFFSMNEGDDPAVYHYREGDQAPKKLDTTLSGYLRRCLEQCEQRNTVGNPA